jgi:hypothetical protein
MTWFKRFRVSFLHWWAETFFVAEENKEPKRQKTKQELREILKKRRK